MQSHCYMIHSEDLGYFLNEIFFKHSIYFRSINVFRLLHLIKLHILMKLKNLSHWHMESVLDNDPLCSHEHYFLSFIYAPFLDTKMTSSYSSEVRENSTF